MVVGFFSIMSMVIIWKISLYLKSKDVKTDMEISRIEMDKEDNRIYNKMFGTDDN